MSLARLRAAGRLATAGAGVTAVLAACLSACGASSKRHATGLALDERPVRIGRGAGYRLPALSGPVIDKAPIGGLRCAAVHRQHFGIHLELYAQRLVLPLPAGVGIAPPQRRRGAYVLGGSCSYPVRTFEPTGVVVVDSGRPLTLGALFAVWGQPLSRSALAGFRGSVIAFVDARRWRAAPDRIPLRRHAEVVVEVRGSVLPHPTYRFPPGL